jgi:hypothetical protein
MRIGSEAHRDLFCRQFVDTHIAYDPATLPWPELDAAALERLRAVPFWQEVLHTERRAGAIVAAFTTAIDDPVIRHAVALQGEEESRHAELLRVMIERYGIAAVEQPIEDLGSDVETAFIDFGYGECVDSFLGFGVFKIARQSGFLPDAMFEIFDTLMHEELRHIVFFVNWMAWREVQKGRGAAWLRGLTSLRFYGRAFRRLLGTVRRGQGANEGRDFSATQASVFLDGFTFRRFLADCHAENVRRMAGIESQLLRPRFLPAVAGMALSGLRLWSFGRSSEARATP